MRLLLGDDPRDGTAARPDELDRGRFVDTAVALLDRVRSHSDSSVLALIGDWGSGKTTVLETLRRILDERGVWGVAEFNPWIYESQTAMTAGFFTELREAMSESERWSRAREAAASKINRGAAVGGVADGLGLPDMSDAITILADMVGGDVSQTGRVRRARAALAKSTRPILMILDDLDRLSPDELLLVLKLVRLVGRLPRVYYLLCYDEQTLLDVLQRTPLVSGRHRAQQYLEKIVQVRLDLPTMREQQADELFGEALEQVLLENDIELNSQEELRLASLYRKALRPTLATPRSINHLLAQVSALQVGLTGEVDFVDFLTVTFLRTSFPDVYRLLPRHKGELLKSTVAMQRSKDQGAFAAKWRERVAEVAPDEQVEVIFAVLTELFPSLLASQHNFTHYPPQTAVGRIASSDYFDRFFVFGVPSDDIADSVVRRAIADLAAGRDSDGVTELGVALLRQPGVTIRKIGSDPQGALAAAKPLLQLIADLYGELSSGRVGIDPHLDFQILAAALLSTIDADVFSAAATDMALTEGGTALLARGVGMFVRRPGEPALPEAVGADSEVLYVRNLPAERVPATRALVGDLVARRLPMPGDALTRTDSGDSPLKHMWELMDVDPDRAEAWLAHGVSSGAWSLIEVLGWLISTLISSAGGPRRLGDLALDLIESVFGLEYVFHTLHDEFVNAPMQPERLPDTPDNRRAVLLASLKREWRKRNEQPDSLSDKSEP